MYLLICKYISITLGLYSDLISACKSGRNPSPIREATNNNELIKVMGLSAPPFSAVLKRLKTNIPMQARSPIMILFPPSFNFLSLTREQNTPTKMTLSKLQLFTITTAGNEAYTTAWLYVYMLKFTTKPQTMALVQGIGRDYVEESWPEDD